MHRRLTVLVLNILLFLPCNSFAISWVDLPRENLSDISKIEEDFIKTVSQKIEYYHSLKKTDYHQIPNRVNALEEIHKLIENYFRNIQFSESKIDMHMYKVITSIRNISKDKKRYLEEIYKMYRNDISDEKVRENFYLYHAGEKGLLSLSEEILYSPQKKQSIGHFWLEAVDPCHRDLKPYYDKWVSLGTDKKFFLWLEEEIIPVNYPSIYYFTEEELDKHHLLCVGPDDKISSEYFRFNEYDEEYMFVVMPGYKIYAAPVSNKIHHSSLSRGAPIIGAGNFIMRDREIKELFLNSGHYLPGENAYKETLIAFFSNNITLPRNVKIKMYRDSKIESVDGEDV